MVGCDSVGGSVTAIFRREFFRLRRSVCFVVGMILLPELTFIVKILEPFYAFLQKSDR